MKVYQTIDYIIDWLNNYCNKSKLNGFVIGISGGIDSAVTSTLCAKTGKPSIVINLPILQEKKQFQRAKEHIKWLKNNFKNIKCINLNLTSVLRSFEIILPVKVQDDLSMANVRSRLRMIALYIFSTHYRMLVTGTGNRIEDFGIGFYTKYGDGGVDILPIGNLLKSQIYKLGDAIGISEKIMTAAPTDGLWSDNRSDEDQIGATYDELEWAMRFKNKNGDESKLGCQDKNILKIYKNLHSKNLHKILPLPICDIPKKLL